MCERARAASTHQSKHMYVNRIKNHIEAHTNAQSNSTRHRDCMYTAPGLTQLYMWSTRDTCDFPFQFVRYINTKNNTALRAMRRSTFAINVQCSHTRTLLCYIMCAGNISCCAGVFACVCLIGVSGAFFPINCAMMCTNLLTMSIGKCSPHALRNCGFFAGETGGMQSSFCI